MKKVVLTVFKGKLLIKRQFPEAMIGNTMGLCTQAFWGSLRYSITGIRLLQQGLEH